MCVEHRYGNPQALRVLLSAKQLFDLFDDACRGGMKGVDASAYSISGADGCKSYFSRRSGDGGEVEVRFKWHFGK